MSSPKLWLRALSFMAPAGSQDITWVSEKAELQEGKYPSGARGKDGPEQFSVQSQVESPFLGCSLGSVLGNSARGK